MKIILIFFLFVLSPTLLFCQDSKKDVTFISGTFGLEMPKNYNTGYTGRLSIGGAIDKNLMIGIGAGVTKFDELPKPIIPVFLNINYISTGTVGGALLLQPGYGFYNNKGIVATKGGITFYGGAGVNFNLQESSTQVLIGYTYYSFNTNSVKSSIGGVSLRLNLVGFL